MILDIHHLPLAALADLVEYIVPAIVFLFWVMGQLFGGKAKPKAAPRPRPQQPVAPVAPGIPAQGGKPPTLEETLRREVEEFMRRAQGGREPVAQQRPPAQPQRQQPGKQQPQTAPRDNRPAKPAGGQRQQSPQPRRLTDAPAPRSESSPMTIEAKRGALTGSSVAQHVTQHVNTGVQALVAHAQHLGADVAQADERMEEHLKEKFSHSLGTLVQQAAAPQVKVAKSPAVLDLLKLMSQPGGARQMVIASEILRRPEERWSRPHAGDG